VPSKNDNAPPSEKGKGGITRIILTLLVMGGGVLVLTVGAAVGGLWLLKLAGVDKEAAVRLPVLLILSVMGLLLAIAVLVAAFKSFELADRTQALGLPEGSVRAMIALMLILLFAIAGLYIYGTLKDNSDVGKQLVTTLSTLVVAVAAFYFGAKAVEAGVAAVQGARPVPGAVSLSPSAVDFGQVPIDGESNPQDFTLTNRTDAPNEVTDVMLKGDAGFEVEASTTPPDPTKRWWPGTKIELKPGDELWIRTKLKWQPQSHPGPVTATLNVQQTAPGAAPTASLKGEFVPPAAAPAEEVTPSTVTPSGKTSPETEVAAPETEVAAPETEEALPFVEEVPPSEEEK
jgi:hypothetical protein